MSVTSMSTGATGISLALENNYMEPIATTLVGAGGVNNITFSDIPQGYKNLQVRSLARVTTGNTLNLYYRYNGDNGSNYSWHRILGNGASVGAGGQSSTTYVVVGQNPGSDVGANIFGTGVMDILDYTNTNKFKTSRTLSGYEDNTGTGAAVQLWSGLWQSTNAITGITFYTDGIFAQHSRFSLYGIKG